jgi:hypothetical protein
MAAAGAGQLRKPCAVPELTRSRAIKLNKRLLLRSNFKRVACSYRRAIEIAGRDFRQNCFRQLLLLIVKAKNHE